MSEHTWTVRAALDWTRSYLADKGDENPRLSAEWLLSAATGLSRIELYAHHDRPLSADERAVLRDGVRRRASGEPLQYVTGEVAFRHIVVKVRPGVLIPRPETEILVGEALSEIAAQPEPLIAEPCTGSGVIACAVASEHPGARVWASDISDTAVAVVSDNVERLGFSQRVSIAVGDLLGALDPALEGRLDAVVSNPPYIPSGNLARLPAEVAGHEPALALDGGSDGLEVFRRLAREAVGFLRPGGVLLVELDESRVRRAAQEAVEWYEGIRVVSDLAGRDRVLVAHRPERDHQST